MAGDSRSPRPHQQQALDALHAVFADHRRAQLIQACGTGKTLVGRWYAEQSRAAVTVVAVPSLALVAQTLQEWRQERSWSFEALITCSDPSTAAGAEERRADDGQDIAEPFWAGLRARVTTSPGVVAHRLAAHSTHRPLVIFSTYHSAGVVAEAVRAARVTVDLIVADEAHVLAGWPNRAFRTVLDDTELPARHRLFMTATPVHTTARADATEGSAALSMSDVSVFGPVAHRLDFAAAIAAGLLVDYRVVVYDTPGQAVQPDPAAALISAAAHGVGSVLSFHGRVAKARAFAAAVDGLKLPDGRTVVARSVAGTDPARVRNEALALLAAGRSEVLVVVSSARCLSVGVDVPAVDGVLFADPKHSDVDVIQSVGRALRPAPGKSRGLVMIPVTVPAEFDDDTALSTGAFSAAWRILRGLRSMDERLSSELQANWRTRSRRGTPDGSRGGARITFALPGTWDLDSVRARIVDFLCPAWDLTFQELREFVAEHGHPRPPRRARLGQWCERQRRAHRSGLLPPDRAELLAELPGWAWDLDEQRWLQQWSQVRDLAGAGGGLDLDDPMISQTVLEHPDGKSPVRTVGRWCAQQRRRRRGGELEQWRIDKLAQVDGWTWHAVSRADAAAVDLLAEYAAWKGHANPPADVVEDDIELGRWLNDVRRRRATGHLSAALLDEIEAATPATEGKVQWLAGATQWLLGYEALRQFVAREGHCIPGRGHVETLPDTAVDLTAWCTRQRFQYRHGRILPARARLLDQVHGWEWERSPAPRIRIDLGDIPHGQNRTGYVKGCRCTPCTEANNRDNAVRAARAAAGEPSTDQVPAERARAHLQDLLAQGVPKRVLVRASGLGRSAVTDILSGKVRRIQPRTEAALLAVDMDATRTAVGGRTAIDAAATWQLLDAMIARGWPKAWIAREAGLGGALQLRRDKVTAANAAKVAALAERLGDRVAPPRRYRQPIPPLQQLLAGEPGGTVQSASDHPRLGRCAPPVEGIGRPLPQRRAS